MIPGMIAEDPDRPVETMSVDGREHVVRRALPRHAGVGQRGPAVTTPALGILAVCATDQTPAPPSDPTRHARTNHPIALTPAEIRRLLNALIWAPVQAIETVLTWSHWRRRHQARARRCHYETRTSHV